MTQPRDDYSLHAGVRWRARLATGLLVAALAGATVRDFKLTGDWVPLPIFRWEGPLPTTTWRHAATAPARPIARPSVTAPMASAEQLNELVEATRLELDAAAIEALNRAREFFVIVPKAATSRRQL